MERPAESSRRQSWSKRYWQPVLDFFHWLGQYELTMLLAGLLIFASIYGFVELAGDVVEGDTHAVDEQILLAMRNPADWRDPIGPYWVEEAMRDFTALGGGGILTLLTLIVTTYLMLQRKFESMALVAAAITGGVLLSLLLKQGFDRPRPDLVPHGAYVTMASFPSGHSMLSAVTYLTLGALLARIHPRRRFKAFFLLVAGLLTLLVGISRIYLGVHWPTDVLGGWAVGAAWALFCWLAARWLQRRGRLGEENDPANE